MRILIGKAGNKTFATIVTTKEELVYQLYYPGESYFKSKVIRDYKNIKDTYYGTSDEKEGELV